MQKYPPVEETEPVWRDICPTIMRRFRFQVKEEEGFSLISREKA